MQQVDLFLLFTGPLDTAGLEYMVSGSVASMVYGEPRLTNDIDIILRKLEYFKEGGSGKHRQDIQGIVEASGDSLDMDALTEWAKRLGLSDDWAEIARPQ